AGSASARGSTRWSWTCTPTRRREARIYRSPASPATTRSARRWSARTRWKASRGRSRRRTDARGPGSVVPAGPALPGHAHAPSPARGDHASSRPLNMMSDESAPLACVAFMLIEDNRVLAEKRKLTKTLVPGAVALPGGHMEGDEDPEEALARQLLEELRIVARGVAHVRTLLHAAHA